MARTLTPLPRHLSSGAFPVRAAYAHGLTRHMLEHERFVAPHRGLRRLSDPHAPTAGREADVAHRLARDYAPLLRQGEAFSHATALLLLGVPIHCSVGLHVTAPLPLAQARGRNVRGHRTQAPFTPELSAHGLLCVPPLMALLQSAPTLSFRELVIAIDSLICIGSRKPFVSRTELTSNIERYSGRGAAVLRAALCVAREGAESRMESLMHFELARMGIDTLELQVELFDAQGKWIGRFDLADRARKLVVEYDGEQHRTNRAQYLRDEQRLEAVRAAGYRVLRLHSEDFQACNLPRTRARLCSFLGVRPQPVDPHLAQYFAVE